MTERLGQRLTMAAERAGGTARLMRAGYWVVIVNNPHGLGVAVDIRGDEYVVLSDWNGSPDRATRDPDAVVAMALEV